MSDIDPQVERARTLINLRRDADAMTLLRSRLAQDPADVDAMYALADALDNLEEYDEALQVARAALALRPDWPYSHQLLSWILVNSGQAHLALEPARQAVALQPDLSVNHRAVSQALRYGVGTQDALREALSYARESVRLDPHDSSTHLEVGQCLADMGSPVAAAAAFEEALRADPTDTYALNAMAHLRSQGGAIAEPIRLNRMALAINPQAGFLQHSFDLLMISLYRQWLRVVIGAFVVIGILVWVEVAYPVRAAVSAPLLGVAGYVAWGQLKEIPPGARRRVSDVRKRSPWPLRITYKLVPFGAFNDVLAGLTPQSSAEFFANLNLIVIFWGLVLAGLIRQIQATTDWVQRMRQQLRRKA